MEKVESIFIEVLEFPFTANGQEIERTFELKNTRYNHVEGISANRVTDQQATVKKCALDGEEVLFSDGVVVDDVFAPHLISKVIDSFFPCSLKIASGKRFVIKLKDTTPAGDFVAHTRKVNLVLTKKVSE